MILSWTASAWEDYLYWQKTDKQTLKRINVLVEATMKLPFEGIGKPEPLKYELVGMWSRRIDQEHRLVYKATEDGILILQCRYHY